MKGFLQNLYYILLFMLAYACHTVQDDYITLLVNKKKFSESITAEGVVEPVKSYSVTCPRVWEVSIAYLIEDGNIVQKGDTVCILQNSELTNDYYQKLSDLDAAQAENNKLSANLELKEAMLIAQVRNNDVLTTIVRLDSVQLKYSTEVQKKLTALEIEKANITKNKLENKLKSLKEINRSELRKMNLRIKQIKNNLERTASQLKQLVLTAPQDGVAMVMSTPYGPGASKFKVGDNVWPGMGLVNIPNLDEMKITLQLTESKYKLLNVGQEVNITFDAKPGVLANGKVSRKSPVGKPVEQGSKIKLFEVTISMPPGPDLPEPGLSANCEIIIRAVPDTLVVPRFAVFDMDSAKYIFVLKNGGIVRQEVAISVESAQEAVVDYGLDSGDIIFLHKPTEKSVTKTVYLKPDTLNVSDHIN